MDLQLDQVVTLKIDKILTKSKLSREMIGLIKTSLNADSEMGEFYKWANLTLMTCECVGGISDVALSGAIAMELSALAIDIFDDIQDQDHDDLPWRQVPIAHALNLAICLGQLGSEAIMPLSDHEDGRPYKKISGILSHMWLTCSDAQFQEALLDNCEQIELVQYFELVERKSGSLTSCACKIGAILGGAPDSVVLQLEQFGAALGIMSQIRNDLNDFLDFEKKRDFVNHKKTLPYVYLSNILEGNRAAQFKALTELTKGRNLKQFGKKEQETLRQLTADEGAFQYCRVMYELFREKSLNLIEAIPVPKKRKEKMVELVKKNV